MSLAFTWQGVVVIVGIAFAWALARHGSSGKKP